MSETIQQQIADIIALASKGWVTQPVFSKTVTVMNNDMKTAQVQLVDHEQRLSLVEAKTQVLTGTTDPTSAPVIIGQIYVNTTSKAVYISAGTTAVTDWQKLN